MASRKRILVVDDNADAALSIALLVRALGHDADVAHDPRAAQDLARRSRPDIVFLDIALPGMTGYELAGRLRGELGSSVRMVALTGFGQDEDRRKSLEAGFDQHLVKPIDMDFLESLLRSA